MDPDHEHFPAHKDGGQGMVVVCTLPGATGEHHLFRHHVDGNGQGGRTLTDLGCPGAVTVLESRGDWCDGFQCRIIRSTSHLRPDRHP